MAVWELVRDAMRGAHDRGREWLTVGEIAREVHKKNPAVHPGTIGLQAKYHCINDPNKRNAPGRQYRTNPLLVTDDPDRHGKSYRLLTEEERRTFLSNPRDDLDKLTYDQAMEFLARPGEASGRPPVPDQATPRPPGGTGTHQQGAAQQRSGVGILATTQDLSGYAFAKVCLIQPECDRGGQPREYLPQGGYRNARSLPLHRYGAGPFCRFRIPANLPVRGVYLLLLDGSVCYVGECENLSARFNMGYGQISPRNCYKGGQQTNCRLNHLILQAVKAGRQLELWFYQTPDRRDVESALIRQLAPPWNSQSRL
jgi:hypothetical protein